MADILVYNKLNENGFENLQGTARGQMVVGVNEHWKARASRTGRVLNAVASFPGFNCPTAGTESTVLQATMTNGFVGIPMRITFGAKGSGFMTVYYTRYVGGTLEKLSFYVASGQPIDMDLNGEIVCAETTKLFIGFAPDVANTPCVASFVYKEELVQWD